MVMVDEASDTIKNCPGNDGSNEGRPFDLATKVTKEIVVCLKKANQVKQYVLRRENQKAQFVEACAKL